MYRTSKFLSSALANSTFAASITLNGQSDSLTIPNWGTPSGSGPIPPVLSAPSAVAAGTNGGVGSVTTSGANGTIAWVVSNAATTPSVTQIKAGQSHTGASAASSGSIIVSSPGVKTTSPAASGLVDDTSYHFHFVHTDTAGGNSAAVTSPVFTTDSHGTGTGTVTANILHRINKANQRCAPEAIQFGCSVAGASVSEPSGRNTYSETFHDLVYVWDFGDPGAVSDKVVNLPAAWNDLNKGHGKFPIHVYSAPGTYTATVCVYELNGTLVGTDTIQVTIADPATLWAGALTIVVAQDGNFSGAPAGATQVTSLSAAIDAKVAANQPTRIMLKRGETYTVTSSIGLFWYFQNWYLTAWGNGPRPVIDATSSGVNNTLFNGGFTSFQGNSIVLDQLRIERDWDTVSGSGTAINGAVSQFRTDVLVTDCEFDGMDSGANMSSETGDGFMFVVHNTSITNWRNFGVGPGLRSWGSCVGVIGCAIYDPPQASEWLKGSSSKAHGPMRIPGGLYIYIDGNDLFSRKGWDAHQPCMRPMATSNENEWPYAWVGRNACEGGWAVIECSHAGGVPSESVNMIIENNLVVATSATRYPISISYQGTTVRNNLIVWPDQKSLLREGTSGPISTEWVCIAWRGAFKDTTAPVLVYNNTAVCRISDANRDGTALRMFPSTTGAVSGANPTDPTSAPLGQGANNVFQSPGNTSFQSEDAKLTTNPIPVAGGGFWTPRWLGRRYLSGALNQVPATQNTLDTSYATPQGQVFDYAPGAGSPLINNASGLTTAFDSQGNQVSGTRDRGWREA